MYGSSPWGVIISSSEPSAVIRQPVFMNSFLANILSEESFLHAFPVHCVMRILLCFALKLSCHMSKFSSSSSHSSNSANHRKLNKIKNAHWTNTSKKKYWYAVSKGSFTLNDLKLTWEAKAFYPLGAYIGLIFCNNVFQWDIFWYFTLNILWFSQGWRWSETFFDAVVEYSTCKYCTWELFEWQTQ